MGRCDALPSGQGSSGCFGAQGSKLDPSSNGGISAKMGLDATKPIESEPMTFKRIHVKGQEDVDLPRVLLDDPKAAFARIVGG